MRTYFISGHLDLTEQEFREHYAAAIGKVLRKPCAFVVGDARGVDAMAQRLLADLGASFTVYHMLAAPRHNAWGAPTVGGFLTDDARDSAMTDASTDDIAWVRPGWEGCGTDRNIRRRKLLAP